jgi:hypothetical protein
LQLADLLAVAIDEHFAVPLGYVPLRISLRVSHLGLLSVQPAGRMSRWRLGRVGAGPGVLGAGLAFAAGIFLRRLADTLTARGARVRKGTPK